MHPSIKQPEEHSPPELVNKNATSHPSTRRRVRKSQNKLRIVTKEQCRIARAKGTRAFALTLTYADNSQFASDQISTFITYLRNKLGSLGYKLQYVWTLEKALALHYHLTMWLPRGFRLTHKDLESRWPWGSTWIAACKSVPAWVKYISKHKDKDNLPAGAKIFAHGGLDHEGREAVRRAEVPHWLKSKLPTGAAPTRISGAWVDTGTGEIFECPWLWTGRGFKLKAEMPAQCPCMMTCGTRSSGQPILEWPPAPGGAL